MNILFIYYIKKDHDIMGAHTAVNLILERCSGEGLEMAFPTQTIHAHVSGTAPAAAGKEVEAGKDSPVSQGQDAWD